MKSKKQLLLLETACLRNFDFFSVIGSERLSCCCQSMQNICKKINAARGFSEFHAVGGCP